jgi:ADP-ribosylglycohydrolase
MTLFTAEGLLRAVCRWNHKGICHPPTVVYHAYVRWLFTQGERSACTWPLDELDGWLVRVRALHACRAPGNTCLDAVRRGRPGTLAERINGSKGCGAVMRAAPIGWIADDAFQSGCEIGALTHGHPTGYLASGALALIIQWLIRGAPLSDAVSLAIERLERESDSWECRTALGRAVALATSTAPSPEAVATLGKGWVAEEALAIAVFCALVAGDDFERGIRLAVNHSGDSDSTGAITGNLLGTILGEGAIPATWLDRLELRNEIGALADDLLVQFRDSEEWWTRYPGW